MRLFYKYICLFAVASFTLPTCSQVTINASIDSLQLLIGEQAHIKVEVSCPTDGELIMPTYPNNRLMDGIEIVGEVKTDTQYLNRKSHMVVTQAYSVTSFDTAFYYIPPFEVQVDNQTYASNPLALKVMTYDIDTTNIQSIYSIKDIWVYKLKAKDFMPLSGAIAVLGLIGFLLPSLIGRYRDNEPVLRRVTIAPQLPPHKIALLEMERIKNEKSWHKDDVKQYYTELTKALRMYIEARFGFDAMEMTSDEIIAHLNEQPIEGWMDELRELFNTSDLVKFAKHKPFINESDMHLINAIGFIRETKVEETVPAAPIVKNIVVKEGCSQQDKVLLILAIVALGVLGVAALYFAISEIIRLFF